MPWYLVSEMRHRLECDNGLDAFALFVMGLKKSKVSCNVVRLMEIRLLGT